MSTIEINTPDGKVLQLDAPEGATTEQIHQAALQASQHYTQANQPTMNPPGLMDSLKMAGRAFLGGSQQDPTNEMAQAGANQTGEDIATSKLGQKFPNLGAGLGTAVSMSPMIAGMALPSIAAREAAQAGDLGIAGRVVSGPGRAEAGAAKGMAERLAGINTDYEPTLKTMSQKLDLPKGTTTKDYLNGLMDRIKSGEPLNPEEAYQHKKLIGSILDKEQTGLLAKIGFKSEKTIGSTSVGLANRLRVYLGNYLNEQVPGRAGPTADYAAAMIRNKIYKYAAGAAATYAGSPLLKALSKHITNE